MEHVISHFKRADPILYKELENVISSEGLKNLFLKRDKEGLFASICQSIINQQLSKKAAETIFTRFKKLFGKQGINAPELLKLGKEELRKTGISYRKINYLEDFARKAAKAEVNLEGLNGLEDEEIIERLVKIKGVGRWTAEMFLMFALGREDIFSYGDLILRTSIEKLYFKKKKPTQREVEEITIKWKPYRTYASRILWRSNKIKNKEEFG